MASTTLTELLKLSPVDRADLAIALWDSLSAQERADVLPLTDEQAEELDARWADHITRPDSGIPWEEVKRKLAGRG